MGITVDSGAADSVESPLSFPGYKVVEHATPQFYQSATGETIINIGEQTIAMVTDDTLRHEVPSYEQGEEAAGVCQEDR